MMSRILIAIPLIVIFLYLTVAMLAWAMQGKLIYPASQERIVPLDGYREVTLTTADGLSLRAFAREAQDGKPTLVYFHGNGGTLMGSMAANAMFAEYGYGLLLVNYRGYGGNPGEPSEEGFYRDGRAAMSWLAEREIDPDQTIIVGNSIGSGTAVQMASEYSPAALVLGAPFTSLVDVASEKARWLPASLLLRDRFDNAGKIGALDMPVLIQHGSQDGLVLPDHGQKLARRAKNATFQLFEGEGHDMMFLPKTQAQRLAWVEGLADQPGGTR
jgi:fermentation-respiration switch protein FrsA (DUF1100 family)